MEVFKAMAYLEGHEKHQLLDVIQHGNHWWLVATWLSHQGTGQRTPERIIRMDGMMIRHQEVRDHEYRFLVNNSIPISVLDGIEQPGYVIAYYPALVDMQGPSEIH